MCLIGNHFGVFIFVGALFPAMILWRAITQNKYGPYEPDARGDDAPRSGLPNEDVRSINAWICLDPKCRRRNPAGAKYCGRCGASRGYTYRVDAESDD